MALWGSGVRIPSAPPNSSSVRRPLFSGCAVSMQCEFGIPHSSQNKKLHSGKIPKAKSRRNREKRKIANHEPMLTSLAPRSNLTAPSPPTRHSQFQINNSKTPLPNSLENKIEKKQSPLLSVANPRLPFHTNRYTPASNLKIILLSLSFLLHSPAMKTNKPNTNPYSSGSGMIWLSLTTHTERLKFTANKEP